MSSSTTSFVPMFMMESMFRNTDVLLAKGEDGCGTTRCEQKEKKSSCCVQNGSNKIGLFRFEIFD